MRTLAFLMLVLTSLPASAGFMELGASINHRYSGYGDNNYATSTSYTASFSYYFWEMCAWELNYTSGYAKQVTEGDDREKTVVEDNIELTSLDLVLSFAERSDPFRPYVKVGAGYLTKERFRRKNNDAGEQISKQYGIVPSAGVGLSLSLTKEFSIKLGMDAWTSPLDKEPLVVDYAARAGVSWML